MEVREVKENTTDSKERHRKTRNRKLEETETERRRRNICIRDKNTAQ
jgi:hypothetical protein